jgi:hypothetical protein
MLRDCSQCHKPLTPQELCKAESRQMENDRRALGLEGVLFWRYECALCGATDIFVDIHPLDGESDEDFRERRDELEEVIRRLHPQEADVVLVERHSGFSVWV